MQIRQTAQLTARVPRPGAGRDARVSACVAGSETVIFSWRRIWTWLLTCCFWSSCRLTDRLFSSLPWLETQPLLMQPTHREQVRTIQLSSCKEGAAEWHQRAHKPGSHNQPRLPAARVPLPGPSCSAEAPASVDRSETVIFSWRGIWTWLPTYCPWPSRRLTDRLFHLL